MRCCPFCFLSQKIPLTNLVSLFEINTNKQVLLRSVQQIFGCLQHKRFSRCIYGRISKHDFKKAKMRG